MYENPRAVKFIKTDSRILVARDWSERDGELSLLGTEFQLYMTGNILEIGCKKVWMHLTLNCPLKNCSIQVSHLVVSDSLWPHRLQHTRLPCSSSTPGACSNSRPSSQWCHLTISSAVVPFSSRLQSFPASGSFQMSQFFTWGGQSIGVSASASLLAMNIQEWFPLGFIQDWFLVGSPCSPRDFQESSPIPQLRSINSLAFSLLYCPNFTSIHVYWKNHSFDYMGICW